MPKSIQYPKFINTAPCGEDLFESGSQKKTAKSIANHIQNKSTDYRLIGLDGSWGAGKSNVISIIKKELEQTNHLFIYDAWSHQEDLQRRSFLEELTENLSDKEIINQEKWNTKLKHLLAKKKETITRTIPKVSPAFFFIIIATALLPFAKVLADSIDKEYLFWKLTVAAAPLLLLLISWLVAAIFIKEYRKVNKLFSVYKEKDLHKTIDETISEKEPSVREFRNWMSELAHDLTKEVIVVFDNMDRLPPEKVQNLWSSIHTFFSEDSYAKIWVIVPFDRTHIKDAFKDNPEKSNHFINKTFSVIFNVSPVVLTDWWDFFKIKYKEAFGETENAEYDIVKSIFDRYHDTITPRKIIAFINELVSLKLIWKDDISLRYMSLFLSSKEKILKDPVTGIMGNGYFDKAKLLFREEENIADIIAALVYNVPVSIASQVTLRREIVVAIRDKNIDRLKELLKHRDFYKILEEVFAKEEIDIEPSAHVINVLDDLVDNDNHKKVVEDIWNIIAGKQLDTPIDELRFTDAHKILLLKSPSYKFRSLVSYILKQFSISRYFQGAAYYIAVNELNSFVEEHEIDINIEDLIPQKEMQPQVFIDYVNAAKDQYADYKVICNNDNLENYLLEKSTVDWQGYQILPFVKQEYTFPKLKKKAEDLISEGAITQENLVKVFDVYKAVSEDQILVKKISDQTIENLLSQVAVNSPEYYELAAMRLARADKFPNSGGTSQSLTALINDTDVNQIASKVEYYADYGSLLKHSVTWPQPLLLEVAKRLTLKPIGTSRMSIIEVLPLFDQIADSLKVTDAELFARLNAWSKFLKLTTNSVEKLIPGFRFYNTAAETDNELSRVIIKTAKEYIESLETEKWKVSFADESSYPFKLLHFILAKGILSGLPNKAVDAYKESLLEMANNGEMPVNDKTAWEEFFKQADKRQLKSTMKNIRDSLINKVDIIPQKFLFFENALRNYGNLDEKSSDTLRRILTPVITDAECLRLIVESKEYYVPLIAKAGDDRLDFVKELRKKVEANPADTSVSSFGHEVDASLAATIKIHEAKYFTEENSVDVTWVLKEKVEKQKTLHFKITNEVLNGSDPHPGVTKKLEIKYEYENNTYNETFNEHEWLNLP